MLPFPPPRVRLAAATYLPAVAFGIRHTQGEGAGGWGSIETQRVGERSIARQRRPVRERKLEESADGALSDCTRENSFTLVRSAGPQAEPQLV